MSVQGIGSLPFDISAIRDHLKAFKSGKGNISKDDVSQVIDGLQQIGINVPNPLQTFQSDFDKIDTNGDGVSKDELKSFAMNQGLLPGGSGPLPGNPLSVTKDDLENLQDVLSLGGKPPPKGLDDLIQRFDAADTDKDGQVDVAELRTYAEQTGITIPGLDNKPAAADSNNGVRLLALQKYAAVEGRQVQTPDLSSLLGNVKA